MPNTIHWICSFPRSGNTWMRFILGNLYFRDIAGSDELERFIPDVHHLGMAGLEERLGSDSGELVIAKTHFTPVHFQDHSFEQKCILIVRNPFDVICSLANYYAGSVIVDEADAIDPEFKAEQLRLALDYVVHSLGELPGVEVFGHWQNHLVAWLHRNHGLPYHLVRYEDLKADPVHEIRKITAFIGHEKPLDLIKVALDKAAFSKLRRIEQHEQGKSDTWFAGNISGLQFFNKGEVGSFKGILSPEQIERIWSACGPAAESCGYRLDELIAD